MQKARAVAQSHFGNKIYIRGLIEIGNCCHNDCFYCGIRKSNRHLKRYRLDAETILACCRHGYELGFRTFVLQGGEDNYMNDDRVTEVVTAIRTEFPDVAITLSLGERPTLSYERFFQAGANRYLLRHETHNEAHYRRLHPEDMSLSNRLRCLNDLKRIGFQTGTGIMLGSPGQTVDHLVEDILFIEQFRPQMIGIGPFLPHHDTPFRFLPSRQSHADTHAAFHLPADASAGIDSFYHRPGKPYARRARERHIGRCQCSDAQPLSGRTAKELCLV